MLKDAQKLDSNDNVAVVIADNLKGSNITINKNLVHLLNDIPAGHKIATDPISKGAHIIKYGFPIGIATKQIDRGEHVHTHNLNTLKLMQQQRNVALIDS